MIVECPGCLRRYDVSGRPPGSLARCACGTAFTLPEPPAGAGTLSCPSCGAGVPGTARTCEYCERALKVRACPRCFRALFAGVRFCSHCGADASAPALTLPDGRARPRDCPRCPDSPRLESQLVSDLMLDACSECDGVYVDAALLERILVARRHAPHDSGEPDPYRTWVKGLEAEQRGASYYIRCPDCDRQMHRRNFGRASGVVVDVCNDHGTWFDADELEAVIRFVQAGGLDAARSAAPLPSSRLTVEEAAPGDPPRVRVRARPARAARPGPAPEVRARPRGRGFLEDVLGALGELL